MHVVCIMPCEKVAPENILIIKSKNKNNNKKNYKKNWVMMFIVMDITNYMKFVPFFVNIYHIMICNKFSKRNFKTNN